MNFQCLRWRLSNSVDRRCKDLVLAKSHTKPGRVIEFDGSGNGDAENTQENRRPSAFSFQWSLERPRESVGRVKSRHIQSDQLSRPVVKVSKLMSSHLIKPRFSRPALLLNTFRNANAGRFFGQGTVHLLKVVYETTCWRKQLPRLVTQSQESSGQRSKTSQHRLASGYQRQRSVNRSSSLTTWWQTRSITRGRSGN